MKFSVISFFLIVSITQFSASAGDCPTAFEAALSQQLTALDKRDLAAYMRVIPLRDKQLMILPDGSTWNSRSQIEKGHEEWFKDESWVFQRELLRKDVRREWGLAIYRVSVDRPDKPGSPFLLSMLFAPEKDGCWYLQHDQNTLLPH